MHFCFACFPRLLHVSLLVAHHVHRRHTTPSHRPNTSQTIHRIDPRTVFNVSQSQVGNMFSKPSACCIVSLLCRMHMGIVDGPRTSGTRSRFRLVQTRPFISSIEAVQPHGCPWFFFFDAPVKLHEPYFQVPIHPPPCTSSPLTSVTRPTHAHLHTISSQRVICHGE